MDRAFEEVKVAEVVSKSCLEVSRPGLAVMGSLVAAVIEVATVIEGAEIEMA